MSEEQTNQTPLEEALAAMERAIDAVKAEAEKLPVFPETRPECCPNQWFKIIERGYTRQTSLDFEDELEGEGVRLLAYTNGFDDFGDDGDFQYVKCLNCGKRWKTPEGLDYV